MKDKEKFKEEIFEICCSGDEIAVDKDTNMPKPCSITGCEQCKFRFLSNCKDAFAEWCNEEYTEPCPFEKGELVEVSDYGNEWCLRYFSYISSDASHKYRTVAKPGSNVTRGWEHCRKYGTLGGLVKEQKMCKENLGCILTEKCTNEEQIRADERAKTIDECFKAIRERYDEVLQKQTKERHEKGLSAYQQPFDCFSSATVEFEIIREVEKKMKGETE